MIDLVLRTFRRYDMLPRGGRVLCALSGGGDSVALLHLLLDLQERRELVLAGAAHFNHGLRGSDADDDERFCRELTASLGVRFVVGRADVREQAKTARRSIEDAARRARYEFLSSAAVELEADAIAVAHTADDQAETFLLRLIRGSGTRGLGGIRPKAGNVIRPLIDVRREALRSYAHARQLAFREDHSNADVAIPRNKIRHELIPCLEHGFSPGIVEVLAREAASAQEDEDRLQAEAIDLGASIVLTSTPTTLDASAFRKLHPALAARVAREALGRLAGERFVGFDHIRRFTEFVERAADGAAMSLPGQQVLRLGDRIVLRPEPRRRVRRAGDTEFVSPGESGRGGAVFRFPLSIPGEVVLGPQGMAVSADWSEGMAEAGCFVAGATLPLAVRSRQPGDRFNPPGLGGRSRKLQDYLVDRKVPRAERDLLPLVVDDDNRIVWVVGYGVAEDFRAPGPASGVISLKARRLGGEG